jgi:ankyrin repeat protein
MKGIGHYVYAGDTLLHVAAAAYASDVARILLDAGADVGARNRRGAEPLHYAADGNPSAHSWDPEAQAGIVSLLIEAGADPNALDKSGVAPLHRAVRTRSTGAVRALLGGGADPMLPNKAGSTAADLASMTTGRGGSGSAEARREQGEIQTLLSSALRGPRTRRQPRG